MNLDYELFSIVEIVNSLCDFRHKEGHNEPKLIITIVRNVFK